MVEFLRQLIAEVTDTRKMPASSNVAEYVLGGNKAADIIEKEIINRLENIGRDKGFKESPDEFT